MSSVAEYVYLVSYEVVASGPGYGVGNTEVSQPGPITSIEVVRAVEEEIEQRVRRQLKGSGTVIRRVWVRSFQLLRVVESDPDFRPARVDRAELN